MIKNIFKIITLFSLFLLSCTIFIFKPIPVFAQGSISGTVTVNGNTPDEEGIDGVFTALYDLDDPVADSLLGLPAPIRGMNAFTIADDDTGIYTFDNLTEGHRYKVLSAVGLMDANLIPTWYGNVPDSADSPEIVVTGDVIGININVLTATGTISGNISNLPEGTSCGILFLDSTLYSLTSMTTSMGGPYAGTFLDANGHYKVAFLAGTDDGKILSSGWYGSSLRWGEYANAKTVLGNTTGVDFDFNFPDQIDDEPGNNSGDGSGQNSGNEEGDGVRSLSQLPETGSGGLSNIVFPVIFFTISTLSYIRKKKTLT